jgi:hypothetical protein
MLLRLRRGEARSSSQLSVWLLPDASKERQVFHRQEQLARAPAARGQESRRRGIYRSRVGAPCSCVVAVTGGGRVGVRGKATEGEKRWARRRWKRPDRLPVHQNILLYLFRYWQSTFASSSVQIYGFQCSIQIYPFQCSNIRTTNMGSG